MAVGRSHAKVYVETDRKVTFKDEVGVDEAKFELQRVVSLLRNPRAYCRLGAGSEGILLAGSLGGLTWDRKGTSCASCGRGD
jgi:cell division protease FtsH